MHVSSGIFRCSLLLCIAFAPAADAQTLRQVETMDVLSSAANRLVASHRE